MIGEIVGGLVGAGVSAYGQARQLKWEKEKAHNAHQWEVEDLKKAGLNPILSAGGTGASAGSIGGIEGNAITEGVNSAFANKIAKENLKLQNKKVKSEIQNQTALTGAQVEQANANTARTLALLPEEIETHRFNRSGRIRRELGTGASARAIELIERAGEKAGTWYGNATTNQPEIKPKKVTPHKLIFKDNKHSYMR